MSAFGQPGQEDRTSDHARWRNLGIVRRKPGLNAIEQILFDNGRSCDLDDFRGGFALARPGRADIVLPTADIDRVVRIWRTGPTPKVPPALVR
jgi:hypothetical protein